MNLFIKLNLVLNQLVNLIDDAKVLQNKIIVKYIDYYFIIRRFVKNLRKNIQNDQREDSRDTKIQG